MAQSKAVATRKNSAVSNIKDQLAQEVAGIQDSIGSASGNRIKTSDKMFTFPDGTTDQGPISLVVVDFVSYNALYEGKYDAKNPQPPICFAIGKSIKDMAPSPNAPEPQASSCAECPMNQFGSDGDGKACKNARRLAVLGPDDVDPEADLMTLDVSPTALKRFDGYVSTVARLHEVPPIGVVTDVGFDPNSTYSSLTFGNPAPNENLEAHFARRAEAEALLTTEPDVSSASTPAKPARTRKKAAPRRGRAA